jgi:FlaA1/EpsC-like NDP-sugar epimerase
METLLGRKPKLDIFSYEDARRLDASKILVTGGAGSIGHSLVKKLLLSCTAEVTMLDIDESRLHTTLLSLPKEVRGRCSSFLADIRDLNSISSAITGIRPTVIIHAAALKHVTFLESHPREALLTNIIGTANLLNACNKIPLQKFVFISTDKAANPKNILGKTKLLGERFVASFGQMNPQIETSVIRFGNVFLSRGSVLETFLHQLSQGEQVTITDPDVERYFIDLEEAASLISAVCSRGLKGISILKMGEPVNIQEIAEKLSRLLSAELKIKYIGLKQGEKMTEDLYTQEELMGSRDLGPFWNADYRKFSSIFARGLVPPVTDLDSIELIEKLLREG